MVCFLLIIYSLVSHALTIQSQWGHVSNSEYRIRGVFVVWWNKKWDRSREANIILEELEKVREQCIGQYGMQDPPNINNGNYINIYLHHGAEDDVFPEGNGVGTDRWGNPFMNIGDASIVNLNHEAFHLYQYNGGVAYGGDSGWFIEASANWYAASRNPNDKWNFVGASSLVHHPQLPIWHSGFFNLEDGEEHNWGRGMHQYGMNTFFNYMTCLKGVSGNVIGSSFYVGSGLTPQKYLFDTIGADRFKKYWLEFISQMAGDYGFLSKEQAEIAEGEWQQWMKDKNDDQRYVATYNDTGTNGQFIKPDWEHMPKGWGYNVFKISNTEDARYSVTLKGSTNGVAGTPAIFDGKTVLKSANGKQYHDLKMTSEQDGSLFFNATASDHEIYIIVAAVPYSFGSNERYPYEIKIERSIIEDGNSDIFHQALNCIEQNYVSLNACDWKHWSAMYSQCDINQHQSLDDGYFIEKVKNGSCNMNNWSNLKRALELREKPETPFDIAVNCVEEYANQGQCDYVHWSEMYLACKTYEFKELDRDDFLLKKYEISNAPRPIGIT